MTHLGALTLGCSFLALSSFAGACVGDLPADASTTGTPAPDAGDDGGDAGSLTPTCTGITRTPMTGGLPSTGGAAVMSAVCTGKILAYVWTKSGVSFGDSLATQTDMLPPNAGMAAAVTAYGVQACNGDGCSNIVTTTFTVAPASGMVDTSACTAQGFDNAVVMNLPAWTESGPLVVSSQGFGPNTALVVKFTTGPTLSTSKTNSGDIAAVEYQQPSPTVRTAVLSSNPCDFNATSPVLGAGAVSEGGKDPDLVFLIGVAAAGVPNLEPNTTYYLNVSNYALGVPANGPTTCSSSDCEMTVTLNKPSGQ